MSLCPSRSDCHTSVSVPLPSPAMRAWNSVWGVLVSGCGARSVPSAAIVAHTEPKAALDLRRPDDHGRLARDADRRPVVIAAAVVERDGLARSPPAGRRGTSTRSRSLPFHSTTRTIGCRRPQRPWPASRIAACRRSIARRAIRRRSWPGAASSAAGSPLALLLAALAPRGRCKSASEISTSPSRRSSFLPSATSSSRKENVPPLVFTVSVASSGASTEIRSPWQSGCCFGLPRASGRRRSSSSCRDGSCRRPPRSFRPGDPPAADFRPAAPILGLHGCRMLRSMRNVHWSRFSSAREAAASVKRIAITWTRQAALRMIGSSKKSITETGCGVKEIHAAPTLYRIATPPR